MNRIIKLNLDSWLRILLVVALFQVFSLVANPQNQITLLSDSLTNAKNDQTKVLIFKQIGVEYYKIDFDSAIYYTSIGLELAEEIGFKKGIADLHNNLGNMYRRLGENVIAINHFVTSLEIKKELGDTLSIASTQSNLGILYNDMDQPDQALIYFLSSLANYQVLNESLKIATLKMNIGNAYLRKGLNDEALQMYYEAKPIFHIYGDSSKLHKITLNIGEYYERETVFDSANLYYKNALQIGYEAAIDDWLCTSCYYMGRLLFNNGDIVNSKKYLLNAFSKAIGLKRPRIITDVSALLCSNYEFEGNFDSALYYSKLYNQYSDSLNDNELNKRLARVEADFEYQSILQENENQITKQRFIRNVMILFSVLVFFLVIYVYRSYRNKQKANRLLAEMDELKSRLFSNISHEFRTPLTLILGPLEEMMELEKDKRPKKKTVKMMQRNANRLLDLVNQMLDLSKVDAGSMKLELVEDEIVKTIKIYILSFASLAENKKIKFSHKFPDDKLITWFDPDKLEKIINNLLSNAFKFTQEGGTVKVDVNLTDTASIPQKLQLTIEDSGAGIPEGELEKIFDRFHQVEEAAEFEAVGTGIGLALTKELVEVMHGKISVESQVGKGTKFILEIPVGKNHLKESEYIIKGVEDVEQKLPEAVPVADEEECDEETSTREEKELGFPMVLTIEDHEDIRIHIRENLEDNFKVIEAEHGKSGLEKAVENIPDLIITDLMMPEMDGVELCKRLKTDERTSHIPVIMLTAKASVEDRLEGLETGADAYVTKPFNIKELRLRVTKLIEQRKQLRERFTREITIEPKDIAVTSADERFLQKAMVCVDEHMGDSDFDVRQFQDEMSMSRMQLFRKLKALTGHTPSEFIRNLRLKRAAKLIEGGFGNVAEVCYEVGFNNLSYFAKCFKELFKVLPSEYVKKTK